MGNQNRKHAYLIMAHDNFQVLGYLIDSLDDVRNDIYLHFDQKTEKLPIFTTKNANLIILRNRVDVRWGNVSQIKCEYVLFEAAFNSGIRYDRYNLISGTHFPLKSQDQIFSFFENFLNKQLISSLYTNSFEINYKLGYYHFSLKDFRSTNSFKRKIGHINWLVLLKIQKVLSIKRSTTDFKIKANNWVSLTHEAVSFVILQKMSILKRFKYTFCGDEYFIPYLLERAKQFKIIEEPLLIFNDFQGGSNPKILDLTDLDRLVSSNYIFARKFSDDKIEILDAIKRVKSL